MKTERYFSPVGGISTFKRYFYWILHAECNAQLYYFRNIHSSTQIVTTYSILRNLSVISLLLEEFRRLNAIFIAFYTPNVVQDIFYFESGAAERKSYTFPRFWRKLSVISLLLAEFRRLNVFFIVLYAPNVVLAIFNVETRAAARKPQSFPRFWRKLSVISLLLEEFRRFEAIFIALYTPNVVHSVIIWETSRAARKS